MFVQLNDECRIIASCDTNCFPEGTYVVEFEFPKDFNIDDQNEYLLIDGELFKYESDSHRNFREEEELLDANNAFLREAPDMLAEQDDAICALYEENLELHSRSNDTDDAICILYELLAGD